MRNHPTQPIVDDADIVADVLQCEEVDWFLTLSMDARGELVQRVVEEMDEPETGHILELAEKIVGQWC